MHQVRAAASDFRNSTCDAMLEWIEGADSIEQCDKVLEEKFRSAARDLAHSVERTLGPSLDATRSHPVVVSAVNAARRVDSIVY